MLPKPNERREKLLRRALDYLYMHSEVPQVLSMALEAEGVNVEALKERHSKWITPLYNVTV